jgi:crotonobetainyl-CoA:carnitine CoA-transferase CaiB-like acyl-CoA transferase
MSEGALAGLRVLELTQVMAGPFCGQVLADMGADVVKVEPPEGGDQSRRSLGFTMSGDDTAAFMAVNRNKRSVALDLKDDDQRDVFLRLVRTADVLIENYRPGVADRLGVGYEALAEINARLVYASISGFGQTGPYAMRPGFDLIAQGLAGVMSVTGEPGGEPVKCGIPISDLSAGLFCAVGILSALAARERTGRGQRIDTSLFEGALALSIWESAELLATGRTPEALGSARATATSPLARTTSACGSDCARRSAVRTSSPTRASRRTPGAWSTAPRSRTSSRRRWPPARPTSGCRSCSRRACRPARSTTTARSSWTRTRSRAR